MGDFYEFFRGLSYTTYKGIPLPERFGAISKGLYYYENETDEDVCLDYSNNYNREIGKKMRICVSFRGLLPPVIMLMQTGLLLSPGS